ncbi:hypothetical protein [Parasitella parasitica]|uniref:Tetratricopeptide repeat and J domain-containing co-chaperone DNJ1 n=1 Tax=Parasitella parasitica TaxID=35722 RepID=A0A0B7MXE5_9FUNG|nr:hypothetical protein [Parasitella parasitica]
MKSNKLLALLIPFFLNTCYADKSIEQHLAEGNQHLVTGKYTDAIMSFDAAIQQDPLDYVSYYKRATAFLSLGRTASAIDDFSKILDLKPGFEKALLQRAKLYAANGDFSLAKRDLLEHGNNKSNQEVKTLIESVEDAERQSILGQQAHQDKNYEQCIQHMTEVIRTAPQKPQWRIIRAKCHIGKGEIEEAANDYTRVAHLNPSDKALLLDLANINFFSLYETERALTQVKQCIHYDPEDRQCKNLFRFIKRIEKEITKSAEAQKGQRYATALNGLIGTGTKSGIVNDIDEPFQRLANDLQAPALPKRLHLKIYSIACELSAKQKDTDKADKWCRLTLELDTQNKEALAHLGEMKLNANDFEGAVRDLEQAFEASGQQDNHIRQLLQRAQQLLKQSKKRDYYKILDVSRDADARTIKKAYRKKAHEWHPDKYSGELDKDQVESKMAEINQAYEVLSDSEKRDQFDNGFDPYDPESAQQQQYGNPFAHHQHHGNPFAHFGGAGNGFPFGTRGQQFSFHF